jgi:hypothetical protein
VEISLRSLLGLVKKNIENDHKRKTVEQVETNDEFVTWILQFLPGGDNAISV